MPRHRRSGTGGCSTGASCSVPIKVIVLPIQASSPVASIEESGGLSHHFDPLLHGRIPVQLGLLVKAFLNDRLDPTVLANSFRRPEPCPRSGLAASSHGQRDLEDVGHDVVDVDRPGVDPRGDGPALCAVPGEHTRGESDICRLRRWQVLDAVAGRSMRLLERRAACMRSVSVRVTGGFHTGGRVCRDTGVRFRRRRPDGQS